MHQSLASEADYYMHLNAGKNFPKRTHPRDSVKPSP